MCSSYIQKTYSFISTFSLRLDGAVSSQGGEVKFTFTSPLLRESILLQHICRLRVRNLLALG